MEVTGTKKVSITISDEEVLRITISTIRKAFKLTKDQYILEGNVVCDEEMGGHNSYTEVEVIRKATVRDIAAYSVLKVLEEA